MKNTLMGIIVLVIVALLVWLYTASMSPQRPETTTSAPQTEQATGSDEQESNNAADTNSMQDEGYTYIFQCADDKAITATFYPENDTHVNLMLSDGRTLSVPHAISASGARYATADESFIFWNKGNTAFVTEDASSTNMTYKDCVTSE